MRVNLDTGSASVDLENNSHAYSWEKSQELVDMTFAALEALGYTERDIKKALESRYGERPE